MKTCRVEGCGQTGTGARVVFNALPPLERPWRRGRREAAEGSSADALM